MNLCTGRIICDYFINPLCDLLSAMATHIYGKMRQRLVTNIKGGWRSVAKKPMPRHAFAALNNLWRSDDSPALLCFYNSLPPCFQSSLTQKNLLTSANKSHNNRPVWQPLHNTQQLCRFRNADALLPLHLFLIPRPLGFIKDDDVFIRNFCRMLAIMAQELVYILYESRNFTLRLLAPVS